MLINKVLSPIKLLWISCFALALTGCADKPLSNSSAPMDGFVLRGNVSGMADSTMLYLADADQANTGRNRDSAMVLQGSFEFRGTLPTPVLRAILKTKNMRDYRFLWLEEKLMTFEGEQGKFREARVTGSDTELQNEKLNALILPVRHEQDSIRTLLEEKELTKGERTKLNSQLQALYQEEEQHYRDFVRDNPTSLISAHVLEVYSSTWGRAATAELFATFSEANQQSPYGQAIANYLRLNKDPKVGEAFADFVQQSHDGRQVSLSDFRGKVVLLEFWASWCGPCRIENPNLVSTYTTYKEKGFEVLAVSLDANREHWLKAIEKDGLTWVHVSELNGNKNTAALIYGINGIPDNFLIDRNGTIVGRNLRGDRLSKRLAELLKD